MKFVRPQRIWLKEHPELTERWVQEGHFAQSPAGTSGARIYPCRAVIQGTTVSKRLVPLRRN